MVGVILGTILVIFFFGDREIKCSYFPNDRVLADLQKKELLFSSEVDCLNECLGADTTFYFHVLRGSVVDFDHNQRGTDNQCTEYKMSFTDTAGEHLFYIENCDSTATVRRWEPASSENCDCL